MEWIKLTEKRPNIFEDVLATNGNNYHIGQRIMENEDYIICTDHPFEYCKVKIHATHWMPLPEKPKND